MFCNVHNSQPGRFYYRFSNLSQYQLTPWWLHDLDMFTAVVAFREGTFHEINNVDWISNADLWWLFGARMNKLLNKQSRVELLVTWVAMSSTYLQCNDPLASLLIHLILKIGHPKISSKGTRYSNQMITLHSMTNPIVSFYTGMHGFIQHLPGPRLSTCDENC